ncbi:hypothetical protein SAMN05518871_104183 [Psychrobacillus sp. OK028]|nr:hypothetical protein [Psychrobacillus sp. OK028]SDN29158.1 hypothetical protein SAMN05518871_104183 [Psychrobacillus sp. OK028]
MDMATLVRKAKKGEDETFEQLVDSVDIRCIGQPMNMLEMNRCS